ncbi:MAG: hypothetical protein RI911_942, partial [Candidatus Parcubacteria bacterium]
LIAIGIFVFFYNTTLQTPLEVIPAPEQQTQQEATPEVMPGEDTLDAAPVGGEVEGKKITNVAEAVSALDGLDTAALDAQLEADLASIEASFE